MVTRTLYYALRNDNGIAVYRYPEREGTEEIALLADAQRLISRDHELPGSQRDDVLIGTSYGEVTVVDFGTVDGGFAQPFFRSHERIFDATSSSEADGRTSTAVGDLV